jgi:hypothetical protein
MIFFSCLRKSHLYRGNYQQDYLDGKLEFPNEPKGFSDAIMNFEAACHRTRQILTECAEMAFDLPLDFLANQCSVKVIFSKKGTKITPQSHIQKFDILELSLWNRLVRVFLLTDGWGKLFSNFSSRFLNPNNFFQYQF